MRCFAAAIDGDTGMILGYDRGGRAQLLAACGAAAERSTAPWTSNSFLGRALRAATPTLLSATPSNGDGLTAASNGNGFTAASNGDGPTAAPRDGEIPTAAWSAVAAPILGPMGALGGIYAGFERPRELEPVRLRWIAGAYARLAALCMEDSGGVATELRSAGLDRLTGCLTYERTLEMLEGEVERSRRNSHRLSCCFLDLDDFKAVNEMHGHLKANRVLDVVGTALREAARPYDGIGRFGGDEFVIVLPETGATAARRAVDRMRWRITFAVEEATGIVLESSAGVAELAPEDTMRSLLEAADHALQAAKAGGGPRSDGPSRQGRLAGFMRRRRPAERASAQAVGEAEARGSG